MKFKIIYQVHYSLFDNYEYFESDLGIAEFKDGFLIDNKKQHTKTSNCKYWIPPSAIRVIEKMRVPINQKLYHK